MSRRFSHLVLILTLALAAPPLHAAEIIDRIVATVNGHIILQSDWDDAVAYQALTNSRAVNEASEADRAAALDRLIDQELLCEQSPSTELPPPSHDELQKRLEDVRAQYPTVASDEAWHGLLASYGLDEKKLEAHLSRELSIMRQVEIRLRPSVQIDSASVESYYRDQFLPSVRQSGAQDVHLEQVSEKIREILTQQKINELFTSWLQNLRTEGRIHTLASTATSPTPTGGQAP